LKDDGAKKATLEEDWLIMNGAEGRGRSKFQRDMNACYEGAKGTWGRYP